MGRKLIYDLPDLAGELFDVLADAEDGMDIHQISSALKVPRAVANQVIRELRLTLGSDDSIALPVKTEGRRWVYFLSSDADRRGPAHEWTKSRMEKAIANFDIDISTWASLSKATDGRTTTGKAARYAQRSIKRIQEDLKDMFLDVELDRDETA